AIECRTVQRSESLEPIKRILLLEHLCKAGDRVRRIEDASAATGAFLQRIDMRRGVGAEEECPLARSRSGAQRQAVLLALGHRQAVVVRANATDKNRVAI